MPKVVCDSCGEEITNVKAAAAVYGNFMANGKKSDVLHVHKNFVRGDCMDKAESVIRSKGWQLGWAELGQHLAFLINNAGMTSEDIAEKLRATDF
jgi:hypothetical protein